MPPLFSLSDLGCRVLCWIVEFYPLLLILFRVLSWFSLLFKLSSISIILLLSFFFYSWTLLNYSTAVSFKLFNSCLACFLYLLIFFETLSYFCSKSMIFSLNFSSIRLFSWHSLVFSESLFWIYYKCIYFFLIYYFGARVTFSNKLRFYSFKLMTS